MTGEHEKTDQEDVDSISASIGILRRAYLLVTEDGLLPLNAWKQEEPHNLSLAQGFLLLWHSISPAVAGKDDAFHQLLLSASLLELLLQDFIQIDDSSALESWIVNPLQVVRGAENNVREAVSEYKALSPYELLEECGEGHAAALTDLLKDRGAIVGNAVQQQFVESLQLGLRKCLVGGQAPTPYLTMLAIWARAADKCGGLFLDVCLNKQNRSSPAVVERLRRLDEMVEMGSWWMVPDLCGTADSPSVYDGPPIASPEEQKPCCVLQ